MVRPLPVLAGFILVAMGTAAPAQEPAGRFQVTPGEGGGFVRLDTRTGAVSHCARRDNAWYCEPLAGADAGTDQRVTVLSAEVQRLTREVARLSAEVLALRAGAPALPAATDQKMSEDEAPGFAGKVMGRFFDLVREMKRKDAAGG
jgi:hypothetical protein